MCHSSLAEERCMSSAGDRHATASHCCRHLAHGSSGGPIAPHGRFGHLPMIETGPSLPISLTLAVRRKDGWPTSTNLEEFGSGASAQCALFAHADSLISHPLRS